MFAAQRTTDGFPGNVIAIGCLLAVCAVLLAQPDVGMTMRATQNSGVEHPGQLNIIDKTAVALKEASVFQPQNRLANTLRSCLIQSDLPLLT